MLEMLSVVAIRVILKKLTPILSLVGERLLRAFPETAAVTYYVYTLLGYRLVDSSCRPHPLNLTRQPLSPE
jgi:hypothetical protein